MLTLVQWNLCLQLLYPRPGIPLRTKVTCLVISLETVLILFPSFSAIMDMLLLSFSRLSIVWRSSKVRCLCFGKSAPPKTGTQHLNLTIYLAVWRHKLCGGQPPHPRGLLVVRSESCLLFEKGAAYSDAAPVAKLHYDQSRSPALLLPSCNTYRL